MRHSARLRGTFLVPCVAAALIVGVSLLAGEDDDPAVDVSVVGREEVVFDWDKDACEPLDVPDSPPRAFRDHRGTVHLITGHFINRASIGPSLNRLRHDCSVVMASDRRSHPSLFNDREWITSTWTSNGKTVFALVHNEYQGHQHPGRCRSGVYKRCWYNAITSGVSRDGGHSFTHTRPPPRHLVASVPYRYFSDEGPYGLFAPSNIISKDGYYYSLIHAEQRGRQEQGACLLRTKDLSDPASWRAWDGEGFGVTFVNPYTAERLDRADHICQPVSFEMIGGMSGSVTYNTYLDRFVLVGISAKYDARRKTAVWGIYFSLSRDLVKWSDRKRIVASGVPWAHRCGDRGPIAYPALLDPNSRSRNFVTTGRRPYLYARRGHYIRCKPTLNRDLIRVRVEFSR
jgi:hypothetical protein